MSKVLSSAVVGWLGGKGKQDPSVHGADGAVASWESVHLDMFGQVVTSSKLLLADWTLVGFHPRVGTPVPGQLI